MTDAAQPRTSEEIAELKTSWWLDPHWDLEHTEGFEAHREELKKYADEYHQDKARQQEDLRLEALPYVQLNWQHNKDMVTVWIVKSQIQMVSQFGSNHIKVHLVGRWEHPVLVLNDELAAPLRWMFDIPDPVEVTHG